MSRYMGQLHRITAFLLNLKATALVQLIAFKTGTTLDHLVICLPLILMVMLYEPILYEPKLGGKNLCWQEFCKLGSLD